MACFNLMVGRCCRKELFFSLKSSQEPVIPCYPQEKGAPHFGEPLITFPIIIFLDQ